MRVKHYLESDRLNVVLCLIVVFIHAFGNVVSHMNPQGFDYIISSFVLRACAFAVQGFIFLSALKFTMAYKNKRFYYVSFLLKRIRKVVIPYIICSAVYYFVFYKLELYNLISFEDLLHKTYIGSTSAHFYFVIVIVQFYVLMPLWVLMSRHIKGIFLIIIGVAVYIAWLFTYIADFEYSDRMMITYIAYWFIGMAAGRNYELFRSFVKRHFLMFLILFEIFLVADCMCYLFMNGFEMIKYMELAHMLYSISAILMLLSLCLQFKDNKMSFVMKSINSLSYHIYLWHCLLLVYMECLIKDYKIDNLHTIAYIKVFGTYAVVLIVSVLWGLIKKLTKSISKRRKQND